MGTGIQRPRPASATLIATLSSGRAGMDPTLEPVAQVSSVLTRTLRVCMEYVELMAQHVRDAKQDGLDQTVIS